MYGTVCRFLGVDDTFAPPLLGTPVNSYVAFRWPRLRRSARKVPPVLRGVVKRLNVRRDSSYPPMDPDIQESLDAYFQEDNAALANWLGRDLSVWSERGTE